MYSSQRTCFESLILKDGTIAISIRPKINTTENFESIIDELYCAINLLFRIYSTSVNTSFYYNNFKSRSTLKKFDNNIYKYMLTINKLFRIDECYMVVPYNFDLELLYAFFY